MDLAERGNSNNKIFTALKIWLYGGFKKRAKLSKCRISSTGQFSTKVTKNKAKNIRERDEREALRKKQKLDNCIINIYYDDDIDFGGLDVVGDMV